MARAGRTEEPAGTPTAVRSRLPVLALGGALAFWLANLAISWTPIAADYRAALSIAYLPMLVEALVGGVLIALCVGYCLMRFFDRIPGRGAMTKSLVLAGAALVVVTLLVEVPSKFVDPVSDAMRYFLVAGLFNAVRLLALGLAVGLLYRRFDRRM